MVRKPFNTAGRKTARAGIDRRTLLIGGGAAAGLLIAWGAWPRSYQPNLNVAANETLFNAFLKIDRAGQIIVVVPQLEMGQGVTTLLPQILADELGADWRTVAVQPAPISPLYANTLLADEELTSDWLTLLGSAGRWAQQQYAVRSALMLTGGSTSVRMFESAYRDAGAAARVLLCKAAAARWDIAWEACDIQNGLITDGPRCPTSCPCDRASTGVWRGRISRASISPRKSTVLPISPPTSACPTWCSPRSGRDRSATPRSKA